MKTGVLYSFTGDWVSPLLATSLWSLRQVSDIPVAIVYEPSNCQTIVDLICNDKRLQPLYAIPKGELIPKCAKKHFMAKAFSYFSSPFDRTLYLDTDTIILRVPTELLEHEISATTIANVTFNGDYHSAEMWAREWNAWRGYGPIVRSMVDRAYALDLPIINLGCWSFSTGHPLLIRMHDLALAAKHTRMCEEGAFQLIQPDYDVALFNETRHWLVKHGRADSWPGDVVHFHSKSWFNSSFGRALWWPWFRRVWDQNVARLREWAAETNHKVKALLGGGIECNGIKPEEIPDEKFKSNDHFDILTRSRIIKEMEARSQS